MVDAPQTRHETKTAETSDTEDVVRRTRRWKWGFITLAVAWALVAVGLIVWSVQSRTADAVDSTATGQVVDTSDRKTEGTGIGLSDEVAATLAPDKVALGATGGEVELKRCDATFTQLSAYSAGLATPVWAAHNNCGGDVILSWVIGQEVTVTTSDTATTYVVVDTRDTSKTKGKTEDLIGMNGLLLLQTCYYGEDRMRFVGLDPVPA